MLSHFRIRTKLGSGFAFIILLLLVLAGVMTYSYRTIETSTGNVTAAVGRSEHINSAIANALRMHRDFLSYLTTHDPTLIDDFHGNLKSAKESITVIYETALIEANRKAAGDILKLYDDINTAADKFVEQETLVSTIKASGTAHARAGIGGLEELATLIGNSVQNKTEIDRAVFDQADKIMEARALVGEVLLRRDNLFAAQTEADYAKYGKEFPEYMGMLIAKLDEAKQYIPPGALADKLAMCTEEFTTWRGIAQNFVINLQALYDMRAPLLDKIGQTIDKNDTMVTNVTNLIHSEGNKQVSTISNSKLIGYIVTGIALLLGITVCVVLTRDITGGIHRAVFAIRLMADEGDVSFEIPPHDLSSHDEVGDLAKAFAALLHQLQTVEHLSKELADGNYTVSTHVRGEKDTMNIYLNEMFDRTNSVLHEISTGVGQVSTGAGEVTNAAQSLSGGAQEAAASLEEITASMSEISGQTKKNAEGASQARDLANHTSEVAAQGQEAMKEMTEAMERITHNSSEIQRVIKVIDDIAFQTNLLALNAAVEAARAGQHGKGFAVVAEEVRNLASRSAKAAKETSELIEKSGHEIERGGGVAAHTAGVLDTIVDQIKQTSDLVSGIAIASNEQAQGVNQVTIGLQQIDAVTQQNTASAEESASAANEMSTMAANLQRLVSQFKLRK